MSIIRRPAYGVNSHGETQTGIVPALSQLIRPPDCVLCLIATSEPAPRKSTEVSEWKRGRPRADFLNDFIASTAHIVGSLV